MFKQHPPAPLPADGVAAAMAPFGQSRMLPREAYVDPAVFEWEQRHIFSGWTCVGHASDLAAVGAQKAVGTGPNAVLLVRGEDKVRAFANTCRHRGHELLACNQTTKGRGIVCPYHSWSYRLDGRAPQRARLHEGRRLRRRRVRARRTAAGELARLAVRRPERRGRRFRRARRGLGRGHRAVPARGPDRRRPALLRARDQLEGHRRELPGVLPLLDDPSGAVPDQPADTAARTCRPRAHGSAAGCRSSKKPRRCR